MKLSCNTGLSGSCYLGSVTVRIVPWGLLCKDVGVGMLYYGEHQNSSVGNSSGPKISQYMLLCLEASGVVDSARTIPMQLM